MNLAELGSLLTIFSSAMAGGACASDQHAGCASILFTLGGAGMGILINRLFVKLYGVVLAPDRGAVASAVLLCLYCLLPLLSIAVGVFATVFVTSAILHGA